MHTAEDIETWIATQIGNALGIDADEIDVDAPFTEHGLDSVAALQLTGELETLLGKTLDATAMFEFPTIATLARHLATA